MKTKKRVYPKSIKIYFPKPEDEELFKSLQAIASRSRLSLSRLAVILLENGLPQVEDALEVFQLHRSLNVKPKPK